MCICGILELAGGRDEKSSKQDWAGTEELHDCRQPSVTQMHRYRGQICAEMMRRQMNERMPFSATIA